jgi:hypothetical protein
MSGTVALPSYKELLWPTLRAVREIGDSGTIEEIVEKVIELEGFTEEEQAVPHRDGVDRSSDELVSPNARRPPWLPSGDPLGFSAWISIHRFSAMPWLMRCPRS